MNPAFKVSRRARRAGPWIAAAGLAVAATSVVAPVALASPVARGDGTIQLLPPNPPVSERAAGPNTVFVQQGLLIFPTGPLTGAGELTVRAVDHPNGVETLTGTWDCVCTVDGATGPLEAHLVGKDDGTTFAGTFTASGSGVLAGFHGAGTFTGSDLTGAGTYTLASHQSF